MWPSIKNGQELLRLILAYSMEDLSLRKHRSLEQPDGSATERGRKAPPLLERVLAHLLTQRLNPKLLPG